MPILEPWDYSIMRSPILPVRDATFGFCDFNHHNEGIVGGGLLCNEFNALPYLFTGMRPPGATRWGKEHKAFQMKNIKRVAGLHGPIQEIPNFDARVTIDPSVKDHWGIPVVALSGATASHGS